MPGLTSKRIKAAKPKRKPYFIWDDRTRGLGLKVAPTGRTTFVVNATRNGTRHIETIGEAVTMPLKEARALAEDRIGALAVLRDPDPDASFEVVAEAVFRRMERLWKPSTAASNRAYLDNRIMPWFRGRTIRDITRQDVEEWFASLGALQGAANRAAPVLSGIFREAEAMGLRPEGRNPVQGLRRYRRPKMERVLTDGEMARLGSALERNRENAPLQTAFVLLLVLTGCRVGELRDLHWRDYRDGKLHLRDSKSGPKTIHLCSHARSVLDGVESMRSGPVFPARRDTRKGLDIRDYWSKIRSETGLDDVRLHDLRHHYATTAIRIGESLNVVGSLLGHNSPRTTMRYTHLDAGAMREAAVLVGRALSNGNGGETE